jgi:hypothetical protein
MSTAERVADRWLPAPGTVAIVSAILLAEVLLATAYVAVARPGITRPFMVVLVPFVWLNGSLFVFWRVRPAATSARRWPAVLVAVAYFGLLAVLGGVVTGGAGTAGDLDVVWRLFPGWAPLFFYDGALVNVLVVPFKLVGYLALTYLVYVTAVDAAGALVGGVVGLFSCISCTFPLIAGLLSSVAGGGGAAAAAVYGNSSLLSTVVFAVTVGLLTWRPSTATVVGLRRALSR